MGLLIKCEYIYIPALEIPEADIEINCVKFLLKNVETRIDPY